MEYRGITEQYIDMAGIWRVRVLINDTDTIFLKFHRQPIEEEVITEVNKYIVSLEKVKIRQTEEINQKIIVEEKLKLVKDIPIVDLKIKLGVDSGIAD